MLIVMLLCGNTKGDKQMKTEYVFGVAYFDSCGAESFYSVEYSKGTLQKYVDGVVNNLGDLK